MCTLFSLDVYMVLMCGPHHNTHHLFTSTVNLQIRPLHSASEKRIQQLEERANSETHNPRAQADYLRVTLLSLK